MLSSASPCREQQRLQEEAPRRASTSRRLRSASASAAGAPPIVFELPMTRDEAVQGAVEGIRRAWAAGRTLPQQVHYRLQCMTSPP